MWIPHLSEAKKVNVCFRYDPTEDSWLELPPMNIARVLAGSVVYKGKIFVIGKRRLI